MEGKIIVGMRYCCVDCVYCEGCYRGLSLSIVSMIFGLYTMNEYVICNANNEEYMDEIDMNLIIHELNENEYD